MPSISKRGYQEFPEFPYLNRGRVGHKTMPNVYPDGPVGEQLDRLHRLNRMVNQYGAVFMGGDHIARFAVHDFLGVRRRTTPVYVRGVEGLTLQQFCDYYAIFSQEVAPIMSFVNIGLEEMKQPQFDADAFAERLRYQLRDLVVDCETMQDMYLIAFFPVCPRSATDETREALRYITNERINEANEALKRMLPRAEEQYTTGLATLHYIDLNAPLTYNGELREYLTLDGLHLSPDAYLRVFEQIMDLFSEPLGPNGSPEPESSFLRMCARMEALERYIIKNGILSRDKLASITAAHDLRAMSTNELLGAMEHFLPPADLRELAKYISYYADDPTEVLRKYEPERFIIKDGGESE